MNFNLLVPLLVTTLAAILGWIVAHYLTARRDLANKRRELRVKYLIDAYRQLEGAAHRDESSNRWADIESAVADIQLFGTPKQVEMARRFAEEFAKNRSAALDSLLSDLRESLRTELQLESVAAGIMHLRITQNKVTKRADR